MATGGGSEDSSYISVAGEAVTRTEGKKAFASKEYKETIELNAIKTMNKNLNEQIRTLKREINNKTDDFKAEKTKLKQSHKRETDNMKRDYYKTIGNQSQVIVRQAEEIKRLKAIIETLEKTVKNLSDKIANAEQDGQLNIEYEEQKREMSAAKKEIRKIREEIVILENTIAEKEKEIFKEKEKNADLSIEFKNLAQKQEHAVAAMKDDLLKDIKERDRSTKDMLQELKELIVQDRSKKTHVEQNPISNNAKFQLPPIRDRSQNPIREPSLTPRSDTKNQWKY